MDCQRAGVSSPEPFRAPHRLAEPTPGRSTCEKKLGTGPEASLTDLRAPPVAYPADPWFDSHQKPNHRVGLEPRHKQTPRRAHLHRQARGAFLLQKSTSSNHCNSVSRQLDQHKLGRIPEGLASLLPTPLLPNAVETMNGNVCTSGPGVRVVRVSPPTMHATPQRP